MSVNQNTSHLKEFLADDFLLNSDLAVKLYQCVKDLPIIDYHCHLDPQEIAENKRFDNIAQLWLDSDHYKWRIMRAAGVNESFITGGAPDYDKFLKWAETIEDAIGSPLYHWTHLELKRCFKYDGILTKETASTIWEHCSKIIKNYGFSVWSILEDFNIEALCTTDDPLDDLRYHKEIKERKIKTRVLPTFRLPSAIDVQNDGFNEYIERLSDITNISITDYESLVDAIYQRIDYFHANGCRLSDHAMDSPAFAAYDMNDLDSIVKAALNHEQVTDHMSCKFSSALFYEMGKKYSELGWAMQLHINASRNNNTAMFNLMGENKGFDSILDTPVVTALSKLLDSLQITDSLPKTIVYSLNPAADDAIATLIAAFQCGVRGKIQHGSAWWFNDTKSGMEKQMISLANNGMLACFVGMLTDSRSFLSYIRHEYFRRIMVNLLANWVVNGEFPNCFDKVSGIAKDIAYRNAKEYFKL